MNHKKIIAFLPTASLCLCLAAGAVGDEETEKTYVCITVRGMGDTPNCILRSRPSRWKTS